MTVSIVKDWEGDMIRQTPGGKGEWEGIRFLNGHSPWADVLIVFNAAPKNLFGFYREGAKWLMSQEPPHSFYKWQTKSYKYYDKVFAFWNKEDFEADKVINIQTCLPWHVNRSYDELVALKPEGISKLDEVSWITSNLNTRPGHQLRLGFMNYLNERKFHYHLFGRGFHSINDKFDGIAPYKYSIAIENFSCPDYWTEKLADCMLSWTIPIYYGCSNISRYFPERSMIRIDPERPDWSFQRIQEALTADYWRENISYLAEARELILNRYQFFPAVVERIRAADISAASRKISFVPKAS